MCRFESTCYVQLSASADGKLTFFAEEIYVGANRAVVYVRENRMGGFFV